MLLISLALSMPAAVLPQERRRITPVVEAVQVARPAVVYIQSTSAPLRRRGRVSLFDLFQHGESQTTGGSGVVIYEDGYIMTNHHVVNGAQRITVSFDEADDPTVYEAQLISTVPEEDLALLKIDGDKPFPTIPLGSDPILGETVIAIGNPYGQTHTVSTGIVSGLHRDIEAASMRFTNLIQTDASINPGNSGGPLLNINGELIGINTAMNLRAENIGFAIPTERVKKVLKEQLLSPAYARTWTGHEMDGLRIAAITPTGPADQAGLQPDDRIVSVGGKPVETQEEYWRFILPLRPQQPIEVEVDRGGRRSLHTLVGWNSLDGFLYEKIGMTVEPFLIGRGYMASVRVASVQPDGPAAELGLRLGDVIPVVQTRGAQARAVKTVEDLALLVSRVPEGGQIDLEIWRDDDRDGTFERDQDYSELYTGTLSVR